MSRRAILAAVVAFVLIDLVSLGTRPVLSPDEARYGAIAAQMLESGDWLHMRMSGFRFLEKPVLDYWMTAASISAFGHNAFAIRLPAALCTGLGGLALAMAAARGSRLRGTDQEGARTMGALAALVYFTMALPVVGASVATLDAPLSGFVTASCAMFFLAATEPREQRGARRMWLCAAGVLAGLGFMTKGLPSIAFPGAAVALWFAWERRWRDLFSMPWIPIAVAAVVVAPWGIAVHLAEPGFWERFIVHEHFKRFAGGAINQPSEPVFFYLWVVPLGMVPWVATLPATARFLWHACRVDTSARFALCWAAGPLLVLSVSSGKLPTYALPVFPPLAWLVVLGLWKWFETMDLRPGKRAWMEFAPGCILIGLGIVACIAAVGGASAEGFVSRVWLEHGHLCAALLGAVLIAWGVGDWWALRAKSAPSRIARMGVAPMGAFASFGLLFPTAIVNDVVSPAASMTAHAATLRDAPVLVTDAKMGHAAAWFLGRSNFYIYEHPEEFNNGLRIPEEEERIVRAVELEAWMAGARRDGSVVFALHAGIADKILKARGMRNPERIERMRGWTMLVYAREPARGSVPESARESVPDDAAP